MKQSLALLLLSFLFTIPSYAEYKPGWDRPIAKSDMKVVSARGFFEHAENVQLFLALRDDAQRSKVKGVLTLSYHDPNAVCLHDRLPDQCGNREITVPITEIKHEGLETIYIAQQTTGDVAVAHRISIVLNTQMAHPWPENDPDQWKVNVREGFGWCGTMDATMEAEGVAEPIFTTQSDK
ncbi:MAG: hypothetical protein WCG27_12230 [Pseudomonadota bacterium]